MTLACQNIINFRPSFKSNTLMKRIIFFNIALIVAYALQLNAQITLDLKVFLEGPFNGTTMNTTLNAQNLIPLSQPYNVAPWNYSGTEQVGAIPNAMVVDWVLVELRETTGDASTATSDKMINRQAAFIKAEGSVVGTDGSSMIVYNGTITSNLYVLIWHRNHLAIMSSSPLTEVEELYSWDFTEELERAYLSGQNSLGNGHYGMAGGDSDGNGGIDMLDYNPEWTTVAGKQGYYPSDLNLDGQVNNPDKNETWLPNLGLSVRVPWECGMNIMDDRDNQSYNTIQIGTQCWLAENLNIGIMIDGGNDQANNTIIEKYCFEDNTENCDVFGGLYQWNEMMQYSTTEGIQGICPPIGGWHLPSDAEWCTLTQYIDPTVNCDNYAWSGTDAGYKMKSWDEWIGGGEGSDEFGFNALPGGMFMTNSGFMYSGMDGFWWTSTQDGAQNGISRDLDFGMDGISRYYYDKGFGFSVRCIKGESTNQPPSLPANPQPSNGASNLSTITTIGWTCTDPENDPLTYDVYFGTANPPAVMVTGQAGTTYDPGILLYNTTYYWKIVAHDDHGNATIGDIWNFTTGTEIVFTCGDILIDGRDGQSYNTVLIGTQCWMAQNMNIGTMITGNQTNNSIIEKYCFGNSQGNCSVFGGLYQWNEVMQYNTTPGVQGICPSGWHVPIDTEWCTLTLYTDPTVDCNAYGFSGSDAGYKLKSIDEWVGGGEGSDEFGFSALPGGMRFTSSYFDFIYTAGWWWTSTQNGTNDAWDRDLDFYEYGIDRYFYNKNNGFSVRCLKNNEPPTSPSNPQPPNGATNQPINTTLSWNCNDPENDPLTYDVYFGNSNSPALVSSGQSINTYNPGTLAYSTTYYWKVVAIDYFDNSMEGPVWSFTTEQTFPCGTALVDERDGQSYNTVQIGTQCWMKENLNIGTMIQGDINMTDNGVIEKYCYGNEGNNCNIYGGLYQWLEMMQYETASGVKGICPANWHLPTDAEWTILEDYLGGYFVAGGKMKTTGDMNEGTGLWYYPNNGATNSSGFSALPGGWRWYGGGEFNYLHSIAFFWASNGWDPGYEGAPYRYIQHEYTGIFPNGDFETAGLSVRCIKN